MRRLAGLMRVRSRRGWLYQYPTSLSSALHQHQHVLALTFISFTAPLLPTPSSLSGTR